MFDQYPDLPITSTEIRFHQLKKVPRKAKRPRLRHKEFYDDQEHLSWYIITGTILTVTIMVLCAFKAWAACLLITLFGLSVFLLSSSVWTLQHIKQLPDDFCLEMPVLHIYISAQCVFNVSDAQRDPNWYTTYCHRQELEVEVELHEADVFLEEYRQYRREFKKAYKTLPGFLQPIAMKFLVRRPKVYPAVQGHFWYITHSGDEKEYTVKASLEQLIACHQHAPRKQLRAQLFDEESA